MKKYFKEQHFSVKNTRHHLHFYDVVGGCNTQRIFFAQLPLLATTRIALNLIINHRYAYLHIVRVYLCAPPSFHKHSHKLRIAVRPHVSTQTHKQNREKKFLCMLHVNCAQQKNAAYSSHYCCAVRIYLRIICALQQQIWSLAPAHI